jgi:Tfp pilus assembly protein PilF
LIREFFAKLPVTEAFSSAQKMLARCLRTTGQRLKNEFSAFDASKCIYGLSLEIDPTSAATHNNMALLLWVCLHDATAAADHFKESLNLDPTDGNTHSNFAHLLAQTQQEPTQTLDHFEKAMSLNPNDSGIPANYAAFLIQQGDLTKSWDLSKRSMRLCLPEPDRTMARALFCAAAILLLRGRDASIPFGQMKTLFADGIDHAPWVLTATLDVLERHLGGDSSHIMRTISAAISDKKGLETLEANPTWQAIRPDSFGTCWPEF